eukprot:SAG22_NODE_14_length_33165_cov_13.196698_39_plen_79_part_00
MIIDSGPQSGESANNFGTNVRVQTVHVRVRMEIIRNKMGGIVVRTITWDLDQTILPGHFWAGWGDTLGAALSGRDAPK